MIRVDSLTQKWPLFPLGECVDFLDHLRRPVKSELRKEGPYPYYGANGQQGTIDNYLFDEDLVLLAEDGGFFGQEGRTIAYRISGKTWVNNHAHVLRPKKDFCVDFLYRVLECYDVTPFITGTTRAKLNKSDASRIPIPRPPIGEQRRIAAILGKADAIRRKRQDALKLVDDLVKSQFIEMVGDPVQNEKTWPIVEIQKFATVKIGPFGSLLHAKDYVEDGIPLVNPSHIIEGKILPDPALTLSHEKFGTMPSYALKEGDVVLGRRGEIGRCAVVDKNEYLCGTGSMFIRIEKDYLPLMLQRVISSDSMRRVLEDKAVGVTMKNLNAGMIAGLPVICPPLSLQNQFARFVEQADKSKFAMQRQLEEGERIKNALMQEYFQ